MNDLENTYISLSDRLRNYLRRRVGSDADADDLVQEVFVKALNAINADKTPKKLEAWLYAAARTTVIDYYRSNKRSENQLDAGEEELLWIENAEDDELEQQLAVCLKSLSLTLPEIYRETLISVDFEGRTMRALAEDAGLSVSAIKSRASRARAMLKERLFECCRIDRANGVMEPIEHRSVCDCDK